MAGDTLSHKVVGKVLFAKTFVKVCVFEVTGVVAFDEFFDQKEISLQNLKSVVQLVSRVAVLVFQILPQNVVWRDFVFEDEFLWFDFTVKNPLLRFLLLFEQERKHPFAFQSELVLDLVHQKPLLRIQMNRHLMV